MCKSIAILVIGSLVFGGCNASPSDRNGQEEAPTGTIPNYQEQLQPKDKDTTINKKDSQGRKQGLWIEDNGLKEVYYLNGLKNGVYKAYFAKTGKLEVLGWYQQDKPIGDWYYFDETSRIYMLEVNVMENTIHKVNRGDGQIIVPEFMSNYRCFYNSGVIKEEGVALYNESIEFGDFFRIGFWKYYDETGKLIKEENYQQGKIAD